MNEKSKTKSGLGKKTLIALGIVIVIMLGATGINYYLKFFGANVKEKDQILYIRTGSAFKDVMDSISAHQMLKDTVSFKWAAENMDYLERVKPGRYRLEKGMSNRRIVNMLKAGNQEPVKLSFRGSRLKTEFAAKVASQLETDSASIMALLDSAAFLEPYGFTPENVYTMFLPNSYEIYWNTSANKFFERMNEEYRKFWTAERKARAKEIGFTPVQVSIMASIVDAEALYDDEMPIIAGLYYNRYTRGIKLQADPTVIFATGDFTIRRVLNRHLAHPSPYNTYRVTGLPPGPIMMPSINALKAVLDYKHHDYIYMCAKEDFSGRHRFASNEEDHLANARKFQQALNARNIKR